MKKINDTLDKYNMKENLNNNLLKEFNELLKNEEFKNFVDLLKVPYETLAQYTSLLEESMCEYDNCKNCKGLVMCKNKVEGYAYLPKVNEKHLEFNYKACKYRELLKKESKYLDNIYSFDIPKEIREAKMKDIYKDDKNRFEVIKWLYNFIEEYPKNKHIKGLYLNGNFGCGKTYLIAAMFNELAKSGYKSAIVFWPEFLRNIKTFDSEYNNKFNLIKTVPLLLIDDIGAENMTSYARDEVFCPIVQYRMQEKLPTFFTSNLNKKELEEHFSITKDGINNIKSRRIIERINQLTDNLEMISKNLRG